MPTTLPATTVAALRRCSIELDQQLTTLPRLRHAYCIRVGLPTDCDIKAQFPSPRPGETKTFLCRSSQQSQIRDESQPSVILSIRLPFRDARTVPSKG
jgi:hypothetical protein